MTLDDAKVLLNDSNISFEVIDYENEKAYWHHTMLFPYTHNAKTCKVKAIVIKSNNGNKDIELQFNEINGMFVFEELRFGGYVFDFYDLVEEILAAELISIVEEIEKGEMIVIVANNLKKRYWIGDALFDLNDDGFGKTGYEKTMLSINNSHKFWDKLFKSKVQYEIYDWNSYQCIIK